MPEQKSRLLRVLFTRMRAWHVPLILAPLAIEWADWHDPIRTVMLLAILGMAPAAEATYVYCMLGDRRIGQWAFWILAVIGVVSFFVGLDITLGPGAVPMVPIGWPVFAPLGACAFIYAVLSTLAVRDNQALQRQPHPYLSAG